MPATVSGPKFMLRLDVTSGDHVGDTRSFHLQTDYANMKLMESELQRAVDEVNSVHAQRINRYLS